MSLSTCASCGCELPYDAPEGLCPRCVMGLAAQPFGRTAATTLGSSGWTPPKPHELERYFPNLDILDLIGQGGMGAVYKARQRGLDRIVALKILPPHFATDPAFSERFHREARALARLNHANIVTVFDSGESGGLFFFLMEYVDGVNLREAMRAGQLSPKEALAIVPQICDALQYAHDVGIVHRDIKPENVLLDQRGRIKIADFGLAKLLRQSSQDFMLTETNQVVGTPRYMAPEQIEGTEIDHRADIYSLGVVFYEMLTGELPLGRFAPPSQKSQLDERLDNVVLKTLEKEPRRRYQHAIDLKSDIQTLGTAEAYYAMRRLGREYKSKTTLFGIPLVHYATGIDPRTGRKRVAKGIIAIGDVAFGGIAIGGAAFGGIALGGVAIGLCTFGGAAIGLLLACGGGAIGGIAVGGLAVGGIALGGGAVGYYAIGGSATGVHIFSPMRRDPAVADSFFLMKNALVVNTRLITGIAVAVTVGVAIVMGFIAFIGRLQRGIEQDRFDKESRDSGVSGAAIITAMFLTGLLFAFGLAGVGYLSLAKRQQAAIAEQLRAREMAELKEAEARLAVEVAERQRRLASNRIWIQTESGPRLRPFVELAQEIDLPTDKEAEIHEVVQATYQEFLVIQRRFAEAELNSETKADSRQQFEKEVAELESRLWVQLDARLTRKQQAGLRTKLDIREMFQMQPSPPSVGESK